MKETQLLSTFFKCQKDNPIKGDWVLTVLDDLSKLNFNKNFEQIKRFNKNAFKKLVKDKIKISALEYLLERKKDKMKNLTYNKIELQPYFLSKSIHRHTAQEIFKWRTHMQDFKYNLNKS